MDKASEFLRDWAKDFIKSKNAIAKSLISIQDSADGIDVKYKDKEQQVLVIPFLSSFYEAFRKLSENPDLNLSIVTFNSEKSYKALVDNWKELVKHRNLSVIFVNPFSANDKKWIIFPHTHAKICDEESLEAGLKSMFETVDIISEEEAGKRV